MTGHEVAAEAPGTQNERTALAWVRTCLGFAGVVALTARLGFLVAPAAGVTAALVGVAVAVVLLRLGDQRYQGARTALTDGGQVLSTTGPVVVTAATLGAAAVAIGFIAVAR